MLPNRPLTDIDLKTFGKKYIPHFRGVYMRDKLQKKAYQIECGIVNLDSNIGSGTHWVAYYKNKSSIKYFDSFGNLQPPIELVNYLGTNIKYNYKRYQNYNTFNCDHLCLEFLYNISK